MKRNATFLVNCTPGNVSVIYFKLIIMSITIKSVKIKYYIVFNK